MAHCAMGWGHMPKCHEGNVQDLTGKAMTDPPQGSPNWLLQTLELAGVGFEKSKNCTSMPRFPTGQGTALYCTKPVPSAMSSRVLATCS